MNTKIEKRLELLNSISEDIVKYMNKSLTDQDMKVEGLRFETEVYNNKVIGFMANLDFGHSVAGEDFSENIVYFDGTLQGLSEGLEEMYEGFDIDEHVSMWLEAKHYGKDDIPPATELVHDAESIDKFLEALDRSFHGFEKTLSAKNQKLLSLPVGRKELSR